MPEITRKRTGELLRRLFEILAGAPEGLPAGVALDRLAASMTLTPYEAGEYQSSGTRRFDKIVRFATVDCVKAGWLLKHKGIWTLTEVGLEAYRAFPEPEAFHKEAVRLYRQWRASQPGGTDNAAAEVQAEVNGGAEKSASITFEQAEEQAWGEIERYLHGMNPYEFQDLVADLLTAMGYHVAWVSPPGRDGGVDIIAHTDPLGTQAPRIKVQVERVEAKVDKDGLKSFLASSATRTSASLSPPAASRATLRSSPAARSGAGSRWWTSNASWTSGSCITPS
jgi:restriction system protein